MGIPSYFSQIIKKYASIVQCLMNKKFESIEHLFMDCNSIIYDSVHELQYNNNDIEFEKDVIKLVIDKIDNYVQTIKPTKNLYIAFDGVAPLAKMEQQRTRRYKTQFLSVLNLTNTMKNDSWNTSAITPGTDFMKKLSEEIKFHFSYKEKNMNLNSIIVSTSEEPGEGEHKLFEYLRKNKNTEDNIALYGLDSDLIMLSICHLNYCNNIYIFREAPEFIKSSLPVTLEKDTDIYLLDIKHLSKSIISEMSCVDNSFNRALDYIFLCFFLGNDFLPHFPAMNIRTHGIDTLLTIYSDTVGKKPNEYIISKDGKINWNHLRPIVSFVAENENKYFLNEYETRKRYEHFKFQQTTEKEKEILFQNTPIIYRQQEKYISPELPYWEKRYYKSLFQKEPKKDFVQNVCNNYLEGLEWVFKYYTSGCVDWRWKYNYHYPPLFKDLLEYVPHFQMDFLISTSTLPFHPHVQLSYVLPPQSQHLLPENIQHFLKKNYHQLYPDRIYFEWAFCRYFWESHPLLPIIPVELLSQWNTQFSLHEIKSK